MRVLRACLALLLLSPSTRGAVEEDWQYIVSLDAGPRKKPASREEALLLARNQLLIQRKAIEQFLVRHPQNDHVFDAKLKLARILAAEGKMDNDPRRVDEALRLFENLESTPGLPSGGGGGRVCPGLARDAGPGGEQPAGARIDRLVGEKLCH